MTLTPRRRPGWRRRLSIAALIVLAASIVASTAKAEEYHLGPQDRIRLKVYEWRASKDVIFDWSALNDEFTVGAGGAIDLPLIGDISASGARPSELATAIADRMKQRIGLMKAPSVAVEVVGYRPFYVLGAVVQPGAFPYRPGLTVMQALSLAGGLQKTEDMAGLKRNVIAGEGDLVLLDLNAANLLARKARLEAELANTEEIRFPKALLDRQTDKTVSVLMEQERAIFKARRDGLNNQVHAMEQLRDFLRSEVEALKTQQNFLEQQVKLTKEELAGVETLVGKGLAVEPRRLALERSVLQVQSERVAAETSLLRARQELSRTEIALLDLRDQRSNEDTTALRETQADLERVDRKSRTAEALLRESTLATPGLLVLGDEAMEAEPAYTISRPGPKGMSVIHAERSTPVYPDDTIEVKMVADRQPSPTN